MSFFFKPMKYRFDLVISYWIFAWFLLHMAGLIRASPKLALCLGLAGNTVQFGAMYYYGHKSFALFLFIFINLFFKVIPLYLVWRERIQWRQDLKNLGILVAAFFLYNAAAGENPVVNMKEAVAAWKDESKNHNEAKIFPGTALINDLRRQWH